MEGDAGGSGEVVLAPSRPDVIDEVIAGEAVVVHLGSGRYFALNAAATQLWVWFEVGRTAAALDAVLDDAPPAWADAARALVGSWVDEQLLAPVPTGAGPGASPALITDGSPEMRTFSDLEDLLLLDPIHDVTLGADGFPVTRPSS